MVDIARTYGPRFGLVQRSVSSIAAGTRAVFASLTSVRSEYWPALSPRYGGVAVGTGRASPGSKAH